MHLASFLLQCLISGALSLITGFVLGRLYLRAERKRAGLLGQFAGRLFRYGPTSPQILEFYAQNAKDGALRRMCKAASDAFEAELVRHQAQAIDRPS
jgi:hypothetical protein